MRRLEEMLIIGEKEAEEGNVSVRKHGEVDLGTMTLEAFSAIIIKEITV